MFQPPLGNFKDGDVLVNTSSTSEFHIGGRAEINRRKLRIYCCLQKRGIKALDQQRFKDNA